MVGRRPYGEGTIYKRGNKWVGRLDIGYTAGGGRKRITVSATSRTEARQKLTRLRRERDAGESGLSPRTTVKAWCEQWLPLQQERVRPNAFTADRAAVRQWIIPVLGRRLLTGLTPADLRKLDAAVIEKRSRSTARRIRATLSVALKAAALEGYAIPARVFQVPPPALEKTDRTAIAAPEAIQLLKAAEDDPMRSRWVAAILQGMRSGECRGLLWDAVDFDAGAIDVSWQAQPLTSVHGCGGTCGRKRGCDCPERTFRVPVGFEHRQILGAWHLTRPKTAAGSRVIPMVPWMHAELLKARENAASPFVWGMQGGRVWTDKDDLNAWHALQERAGVRHPDGRYYHLHEARHSTATILLALGIAPQIVEAIMGHSSMLSTKQYQHVDIAMMRKALDSVASTLQIEGHDSL